MYSNEERQKAVDLLIQYDEQFTLVTNTLGYPSRAMLYKWYKEYLESGPFDTGAKRCRMDKYSKEQKQEAVTYYLEHGKSISKTVRSLGFPKTKGLLSQWIDELAPDEKRIYRKAKVTSTTQKKEPKGKDSKVDGVKPDIYDWRKHLAAHVSIVPKPFVFTGDTMGEPKNIEEADAELKRKLKRMQEVEDALKERERALAEAELQLDIYQATLDLLKKEMGTVPNRLTNKEKTIVANALRGKWGLRRVLKALGLAKSSYEYQLHLLTQNEAQEVVKLKQCIKEAFEKAHGIYGYRRLLAELNADDKTKISEWKLRKYMKELGLHAKVAKKKRYSSYEGEISKAPENTCLDENGKHDFSADKPNELWITDISEFGIAQGKVYLSPIIDCFDGMPISWSIGTSPNAELANSSLIDACKQLKSNKCPRIHSDRGGHYRWNEWIEICNANQLKRSMSRLGHSPDNSRCEGFFGRLKIEFFYGRDWSSTTQDEFMEQLNDYMLWYRDKRRKSDLGYLSPKDYRTSLGLVA